MSGYSLVLVTLLDFLVANANTELATPRPKDSYLGRMSEGWMFL